MVKKKTLTFVENFAFLIPLILFVPTPLFIDIVLYMMLGVEAIRLQHQQTHVKVLFTSVQSIG